MADTEPSPEADYTDDDVTRLAGWLIDRGFSPRVADYTARHLLDQGVTLPPPPPDPAVVVAEALGALAACDGCATCSRMAADALAAYENPAPVATEATQRGGRP